MLSAASPRWYLPARLIPRMPPPTFSSSPAPRSSSAPWSSPASTAFLSGDLSSAWIDADRVHAWVMVWAPLGGLVVALLMVSRVPYPHVTKQLLRGRHQFSHLVEILLLAGLLVVTYELALFLV